MRHLPRVYVPALALMLCCMVGCGGTVCSQIGDARSSLNLAIDITHTARASLMISPAEEKAVLPIFVAVDASLTEAENNCLAEQAAIAKGDKVAADTAIQKANKYLKAALAGLRAYSAAEAPQAKALRASRAATQPTH